MSPSNSNNVTKAELKNEIKETRELIESIKSMGADVESAEVIISQAENALKANNLDLTKALIESTIQTFALIKQQYFVQAASILFSSLQRSIMGLEGAGSEVEYVKDLYHKAKEKFDSGQYEEAMEYIKSAEDMANNLKANLPEEVIYSHNDEEGAAGGVEGVDYEGSQEQMEKVSRVLIRVEKLLQEAMEEGYSVNEAEKLYSLAEDAFDYQDYKKAEDYAMQSERTLKEILEPLHDERQQKKIKDKEPPEELGGGYMKKREDIPSGDSFAKSDAYYSDIMPKGILGDAPRLIEEKDITTGNELISAEAEEIDSELKIEKEATNLLITADEKITAAKDSGLNIPMAERLLTIGESYFDRGEFDRVKEYAEKAIRQIDEIAARKGITKEVEAKIAAGAQEKNSLAATETVEPAEEELVVEPKVEEVEFIEEPEEEEVGEITIKEEELAKKTEKPESISPNN